MLAIVVGALAGGCAVAASPVPSPTPAASLTPTASPPASPTAAPTATAVPSPAATARPIALRQAPANMGCDTIGIDYRRLTFRIDPNAAEQVVAVTESNAQLQTNWSPGFRQGPNGARTIVDPSGKVVATDGQVLEVPSGAYPRLAGYFVCLGPTAIYVLITDPA